MSDLAVRVATAADLAAVDALLARSYPALLKADYAPSVMVAVLPLIARANPALVTCGSYFVAVTGGAVVGAGGWTRNAPSGGAEPGLGHIRHVVTDHSRQRAGIGRALLNEVKRSAAAAGMTRLECWSTLTAVPFYTAMGFAPLGPLEVPIGPARIPFPSIRMIAAL
ncbi:MAG: GNAT family N-acetyltransferase [Pseudomonadota bacterium]